MQSIHDSYVNIIGWACGTRQLVVIILQLGAIKAMQTNRTQQMVYSSQYNILLWEGWVKLRRDASFMTLEHQLFHTNSLNKHSTKSKEMCVWQIISLL